MRVRPSFAADIESSSPEQLESIKLLLHIREHIEKARARVDERQEKCRCTSGVPILVDGEGSGPHLRKIECGRCGQAFGWIPQVKNYGKRPKNGAQKTTEFCQMCRRQNVVLTAHHVIEVSEGGKDGPENIWTVCEQCHVMIHAVRRIAGLYRETPT